MSNKSRRHDGAAHPRAIADPTQICAGCRLPIYEGTLDQSVTPNSGEATVGADAIKWRHLSDGLPIGLAPRLHRVTLKMPAEAAA